MVGRVGEWWLVTSKLIRSVGTFKAVMCGAFGDGRVGSDTSIGRQPGLVEAVASEALR